MKTIKTSFSASGYFLYFKSTVFGIIIGAISIVILLLLFSAVLLISGALPHDVLIWLDIAACAVGSYIAGYTSARITKHNAIFTGALSGICIFLILLTAGLIGGENFTYITLIKLATILLLTIIGAVKGVNKKDKLRIK